MKKLLTIGMFGLLSIGHMFPHVPTQSIFGEDAIHRIESIDQEKANSIKSLFSQYSYDEYDFYQALLTLHSNQKCDERNILALILQYQNKELNPITTFDKSALIEFLKYYKNLRAQEIIDMVQDSSGNSGFGDTKVEDNLVGLSYSTAFFYVASIVPHTHTSPKTNIVYESDFNPLAFTELKGIFQGVFLTIGTYNLFKIIRYYYNIRRLEREMRKIDQVILTIETFQQ